MELITTTRGLMDPALLEKRVGTVDDEGARLEWVEYWDGADLVHRSVNIVLTGVEMKISEGSFS